MENLSNPKLTEFIRDEIKSTGPISFARFMEFALYHPEWGYYCSPREKIGPKGDYYTSLSVHPIFATLLGKQVLQMILAIQCNDEKITLIEFGAGEGTLCLGILDYLQKQAPEIFSRVTYIIIEKSLSFQARQKERLFPAYANNVLWMDNMPQNQIGIVLSNEFVDALPVHRMRGEKEVYVDWENGTFRERLEGPSSPDLVSYFDRLGIKINEQFDYEINLAALDWMREVGQSLKKGFVLTVDYGYPSGQLVTPARKRGTLLCYYKHTVCEDPYQHIGEQDMTSHIDFTSLANVGESVGLHVSGFTDQTHFLMGLGIAQEMQGAADQMEESEVARKNFVAMKQLMAPDRMGKTFKILIQEKSAAFPTPLDGLTYKAFPKDCQLNSTF